MVATAPPAFSDGDPIVAWQRHSRRLFHALFK
jgi:hypothetical protein